MQATPLKRLADLWLGTDPVQRLRLRQTSLAMALMALCAPVLHYCVLIAHGERGPWLWLWTAWSVGGMALFYGCIRSGHSCRFADPSLTSVQIAFAISSAAFGYALAGPLRGAVFPVLTLILMFGMFQLRARSAYALSFFALVLFGAVMTTMALRQSDSYPPLVEFGHFLMLALMLPAVAVLTARMSVIRQRLSQQRQDLARALAQLEVIATRDELTGLPNRRQMQALMDQELLRSQRHPHDFCIALVDLDHFKRINDSQGHAAGDTVLRHFAQAGQAALRATDVLARWGGEEFLVLLPDTPLPQAQAALERLREQVAALRVRIAEGGEIRLTVSIGLAAHRAGDTLAQTLARADRWLYEAKAQGRNRLQADAPTEAPAARLA